MPLELDDRAHALENEYIYRKEREMMEKLKAKISSENLSAGEMKCPKCDGKLVETKFENVKIDVCDNCTGVWLDASEFAQIAHHDTENKGWFSRHFG